MCCTKPAMPALWVQVEQGVTKPWPNLYLYMYYAPMASTHMREPGNKFIYGPISHAWM